MGGMRGMSGFGVTMDDMEGMGGFEATMGGMGGMDGIKATMGGMGGMSFASLMGGMRAPPGGHMSSGVPPYIPSHDVVEDLANTYRARHDDASRVNEEKEEEESSSDEDEETKEEEDEDEV
ncbi:hypothetical protein ZWY2020_033175 [Hordeum vulgare]|nr:hypothetical protein ZWY2020_033175 [Hordeum vulgare]